MVSNCEIVRKSIDVVWNGGDLGRIPDFYTESFTAHYPAASPSWGEGLAGLRSFIELVRTGFPDYRENVQDIHEVGDRVFVRMRNTGTHEGPLPIAAAPTGRPIEVDDFVHIRMEGGKIAEQWGLFDSLTMLLQLGVLEPPILTASD